MRVLKVVMVTWGLWLSFVGCGGGGDASSNSADFVTDFKTAVCNQYVPCGTYPDRDSCNKAVALAFDDSLAWMKASIAAGRMKYHPDRAKICFDSFPLSSCRLYALEDRATTAACDEMLEGTLAAGSTCAGHEECLSRNCGKQTCSTLCCTGVCQEGPRRQADGASCVSSSECAATSYCEIGSAVRGTCRPTLAVGQPCTSGVGCSSGALCVGKTGARTCQPYAKDGESCADGRTCESSLSYCDPSDSKCKTRHKVGESCSGLGSCIGYAACVNGTCIARPTLGQPCTPPDAGATEGRCLVGTCTNGTCSAPPPAASCVDAGTAQQDGGIPRG